MKKIGKLLLVILLVLCLSSHGYSFLYSVGEGAYTHAAGLVSRVGKLIADKSTITEVTYEEYYEVPPEFQNAYNSLSDTQKNLYVTLRAISSQMPTGFIKLHAGYSTAKRDICIAYNALLYDNPEIFWMPNSYILKNYEKSGKEYVAIAFDLADDDRNLHYNVSKTQRDKMKKELLARVKRVVSQVDSSLSDYNKEKAVNDYLCDNTEYVRDGELINSAYSALVNGKALCEGYAKAFKILCNEMGVECDLVCGYSQGEGHMWNVVNIDGVHAYTDVTWNDTESYRSYRYFNITTAQLKYDHIISPLHTKASDKDITDNFFNFVDRQATYTGNTYYEKTDCVLSLNYLDNAVKVITARHLSGYTYTELMFTSETTLAKFKKDEKAFINGLQAALEGIRIKTYAFDRDVLLVTHE